MAEEVKNNDVVSAEEGEATEFDPVQAINELKQNSVSRQEYNKVVKEKNKYLKALVNGSGYENQPKNNLKTLDELKHDIYGDKMDGNTKCKNDLELAKTMLEYRNRTIEEEGWDMWAGQISPDSPRYGKQLYVPTDDDFASAQEVADYFQYCIDKADGDNKVFTTVFGNGLVGGAPEINPKIKR